MPLNDAVESTRKKVADMSRNRVVAGARRRQS